MGTFWPRINKLFSGVILLSFILSSHGCKETKPSEEDALTKEVYVPQKNEVGIEVLQKRPFKEELLANGKLVALEKNVLKFEVSGTLEQLNVKNGEQVVQGQVLAILGKFKYDQAVAMAETAKQKADLDFEDILVGRGYDLAHPDSIPDNIYNMATIRSGKREAENRLANANFELNSSILHAPFRGKVASIRYKAHEQINSGAEFLTLIDDSVFEVEFHLIESEINNIKVGENVEILTFDSEKNYLGKITSLNPLVEQNGTVLVKATIKNDGQLIEGMNVKVRIQKDLPDQFVVPKSAIILRQNQEVLFKYQQGKTYWTYVNTVYENSNEYAIVPDLEKSSTTLVEGDTVIVSGNLNLAHDTEVDIRQ